MNFCSKMKHFILFSLIFFNVFLIHGASDKKHYIVYMGDHAQRSSDDIISSNHLLLSSISGSDVGAKSATVHHYSRSFRGFSAMLTAEQAQKLKGNEEVISVFESKMNELHSTHSWDFLGLKLSGDGHNLLGLGSDVIVGSIDTGVWPESLSFSDTGLGPAPKRFRGECITGENFTTINCNRKIVGARYYYKGFEAVNGPLESIGQKFFRSARDGDGHGSHTASTVAGSLTPHVSMLGMGSGRARGGAIGARLAVYKACWFLLCEDADLLAAFDDAVADDVDIISISAGPSSPQPSYFEDAISIGAFHAFGKNILVSASAGNEGLPGSATNVAPWILTVAASSVDRKFDTYLYLGNSKVLQGTSLNSLSLMGPYGIVSASKAAKPGVSMTGASSCLNNTLNPEMVAGKIVVCITGQILEDRRRKAIVVKQAGGVGMILFDPVAVDVAFQFVVPSVLIGLPEAKELNAYMDLAKEPVANISQTFTVIGTTPAPQMAVFSSKGPNVITPDIIKPDIAAPGMNIIAAWSPVAVAGTANIPLDFNIISGTSMSCPHVSATAAIVKSYHMDWSAAAIKSALMTTAKVMDNTKSPITQYPNSLLANPFDYGSGHLDPIAALNPGLVYDMEPDDVIHYLCSKGANYTQLTKLTNESISCTVPASESYKFNYPSIGVGNVTGLVSVYRTVTNVADGPRLYSSILEFPAGVIVSVHPHELKFDKAGEKLGFQVDLAPTRPSKGSFVFGSITWTDGVHFVRSPIALNVISV